MAHSSINSQDVDDAVAVIQRSTGRFHSLRFVGGKSVIQDGNRAAEPQADWLPAGVCGHPCRGAGMSCRRAPQGVRRTGGSRICRGGRGFQQTGFRTAPSAHRCRQRRIDGSVSLPAKNNNSMIIPVVRSAGVAVGQAASCRQRIRSKSFAGEFLLGCPSRPHNFILMASVYWPHVFKKWACC